MRKYSEFLFLWHLLLVWYVLLESDSLFFCERGKEDPLFSHCI